MKRRVTETSVSTPIPTNTDRMRSRSSVIIPEEEAPEPSGAENSGPVTPEVAGRAGAGSRNVSPNQSRAGEAGESSPIGLQEKRLRKPPMRYGIEELF